jgi:hypothetical protein
MSNVLRCAGLNCVRIDWRGLARRLRKHRTALIALAVYNFVLFFPVAFMGRAVSPNDVFYNYEPWATFRPADLQTQNASLNDPPTAYFTLMSLARRDWSAFHWNPYIASGIPGFGSSASAILSPFILVPVLIVPEAWIYTAILFLKLNASFLFAYFWLREERLGKKGSAIGAIVIAGAGVYAVRWLWQLTNATVLYPALLWIARRALNGKRNSVTAVALVALAYALAGFPAAMAYGAWIVVAFALFTLVQRRRSIRRMKLLAPVLGVVIGVMVATPSLVPFAQFLRRSGYLEARQSTGLTTVFPPDHWRSFVDPDRLGHHAYKDWIGDRRLGPLDNYTESTIYLGLLTIPLALLGIFQRRARARWFWLAVAIFALACMFGAPGVSPFVARLPGFKFSALARVGLLLPLAAGYLAASGTRFLRWPVVPMLFGVILAFDLALLAGRFYPYLKPEQAQIPATPMIDALHAERAPFRVAPFFDYLWPNTAEYARVEDVRSHFGSELDYRRMLVRLDPTVWSGTSTVLTFNSLQYHFDDPLAGLLGIRWYVEHNTIDIIKWGIFKATVPGVTERGGIHMRPGEVLERTVRIDAEPFWAIEVPFHIDEVLRPDGRLHVTLLKNGVAVWSRAFAQADSNVMDKLYVPLRPYARLGETVTLRLRADGVRGGGLGAANDNPREAALFYGRVTTPVIFDRQLPEGRLFRNLSELPRFRAVTRLRKLNNDEFLGARDVDFESEAVITDDPIMPPQLAPANARVALTHYAPAEQRITTESDGDFYLASSEKLTPELRVTIDGRVARAIETDMLFAGVTVPAGRHEVVFSRRIARGWWWVASMGMMVWLAAIAFRLRGLSRAASQQRG